MLSLLGGGKNDGKKHGKEQGRLFFWREILEDTKVKKGRSRKSYIRKGMGVKERKKREKNSFNKKNIYIYIL